MFFTDSVHHVEIVGECSMFSLEDDDMEPWEDCVSFSTLNCQWNLFELYICCKFQQKKKKEKLKFIHTIRNDFSCVYGNAVQFNYADPKFLMFLLLLLLLFFLFEGGCINLKLFHWITTVKLTKPETAELFMECFCVEKKKLINSGKSKPWMETVVSFCLHVLNLIVTNGKHPAKNCPTLDNQRNECPLWGNSKPRITFLLPLLV